MAIKGQAPGTCVRGVVSTASRGSLPRKATGVAASDRETAVGVKVGVSRTGLDVARRFRWTVGRVRRGMTALVALWRVLSPSK